MSDDLWPGPLRRVSVSSVLFGAFCVVGFVCLVDVIRTVLK